MSWMKRAQPGEGAGTGPQPYGPPQAQPYANQPNVYANYSAGPGNAQQQTSQQGQYWQAAPPAPSQQQYNQQYGAVYQQEYPPNANQMYQQAQYNHNYSSTGYTNPQQGYQQNFYQNQPQPNYTQNQAHNNDGWEDNWDWGWEESAKQAQRAQKTAAQNPPQQQEHAFNNANVLEESFANTSTSWNWATDDKKVSKEPETLPPQQVNNEPATLPLNSVENNMTLEPKNTHTINNGAPSPTDGVKTLSDRDIVKEHMPNLALGKRFHLDNLTPQWSIESQMSQESSDGPHTHSESTYRSENQSRNSGSNSPGPNTDNSNFNYSQSGLDEGYTRNSEWSRQSDEPTLADSVHTGSRRESHEELVHTMQDLTLVNHENISPENTQVSSAIERRSSQQSSAPAQLAPAESPALPPPAAVTQPPPPAMSMPPPPPVSVPAPSPSMVPSVRPPSGGSSVPPPPGPTQLAAPPPADAVPPPPTVASLPPANFPPPSNSQNPFKHAGPFAHKPKASSSSAPGPSQFPPPLSANLVSPAVVKASASRPPPPLPVGFEANLETAPDNSERPDAPAAAGAWGAPPAPHSVPDNMEVAPRSDRNEYLQTAHLSAEYGENAELAPAGPRRSGVGRHEPAPGDEPPPGLARMVPGRQTDGDGACERPGEPYRGTWRPLARATPAGEPAPEYATYPRRAPDLEGSDNPQQLAAGEPPRARSADAERAPEPARRSSADTDRDRPYDASPRRGSRDRDRDRDRDRKPRSERERRERRDRRPRDESPDARRKRRSARAHRYETEDTDYYSDKERERRRHREGSYSSRPPRGDEARRREEREGGSRARRHDHERSYRDIDPARKYGNRRRDRDDHERRRGEQYSSPSRTATDEEPERRRERPRRRTHDPYYDGYGVPGGVGGAYADPYLAQRAQYEYYERLRATDPAAYMQLYKRLMAGRQDHHGLEGYLGAGCGAREERGSVHSGRSSAAGLKGNDTEVSLPTNLDASVARSERTTPRRFSTAHVKGSISSRHVVVVRPSWPVDGLPATVQILSLPHALQHDPLAVELQNCPGPLVKGVTHKKSVIEYCMVRVRSAAREAPRDADGYGLIWELLALLLRQNGVVVGSDIAELLMKNTREHEHKTATNKHNGSRRDSSVSGSAEEARSSPDLADLAEAPADTNASGEAGAGERAALDKYREYLLYGNRQEALEWAMSCGLWGHALHLAAYSDRRTRSAAAARFLAATPRADPLHTLYATLAAATPPAATSASGDWRPHAAIVLANAGARPDHDTRTLTLLGDRLASRGLLYSAQFCYVAGGVRFARHPLAPLGAAAEPGPETGAQPPRLSLLLADPRARTLAALATTRSILATEIYEYALSLNQDYVIPELQVYKFVAACRLADCGLYERALAYVEHAARAVTRAPRRYPPLLLRNLAEMADRLKYHDPALLEDPPLLEEGSSEGSPRHQQWLHDVQTAAQMMQMEPQPAPAQLAAPDYYGQQEQPHYWDQTQYQQQLVPQPAAAGAEPEEAAEHSQPYYPPPAAEPEPVPAPAPQHAYEDWSRTEEHHAQQYADPGAGTYWQPEHAYTGYGEGGAGSGAAGAGGEESPRPTITMPGAHAPHRAYGDETDESRPDEQPQEREPETPKSSARKAGGEGGKGGGWLGGILTKLSLRPPNQMILPDDKNPTIVWDAENKRWRNLDGEETDGEPPPPPPRLHDLAQRMTSTPNASPGAPPAAGGAPPVSNIFKMQKGRHIKKSYVDVFNPSGAAGRPLPPAAAVLGPAPALADNPNYFVPPAPNQNDVYDPLASEHGM